MNFDELYQEVILDNSRRPKNFGELPNATAAAWGNNPSCGDEIHVAISSGESGRVDEIRFKGSGCAICMASTSLMTAFVKGKTREEALQAQESFQKMLTSSEDIPPMKGNLGLLHGVRKFPQRIKCATLGWCALKQALEQGTGQTTTEG